MFHVSGQHLKRKKWVHCFERVTSVIFYPTFTEYDQVLLDESKTVHPITILMVFGVQDFDFCEFFLLL